MKSVVSGKCDLDERSVATMKHKIFVLEKQLDIAVGVNLQIVVHSDGIHLYRK